jgi:Lantibiotic biosynthesis dehydratase C-term
VNGEWQWTRIYYFEDCKDALILDAVWPAIQQISAAGGAGFFQRKGDGGPNILVGLRGADAHGVAAVRTAINHYLLQNPSRRDFSALEHERLSQTMMNWEKQRGNIAPQPNNTVLDCPGPESPLLRPGKLQEAIREFLCRSAELVIEWLKLVRNDTFQREDIALHAMIALAWVANPTNLRSCVSFGSHAGGFMRKAGPNHKIGEAFARAYEGPKGETIRTFVQRAIEDLVRGHDSIPRLKEWTALVRDTMTDSYHRLIDGEYETFSVRQFDYPEDYRKLLSMLDDSPALRSWQVTVNVVYQALNQLGISSLQRFYACYLLYRAADDLYGGLSKIRAQLEEDRDTSGMLPFFAAWEQNRPAGGMNLYTVDEKILS